MFLYSAVSDIVIGNKSGYKKCGIDPQIPRVFR